MSAEKAKESIDMRGKTITTYIVYQAVKKLQKMESGDLLEVVTDNLEAIDTDLKAWCRTTGHEITTMETAGDSQQYFIKRGHFQKPNKILAIVISKAGLEELLSPLGFSLGAALEGIEVHMYFQGPAVRLFKNGFQAKLSGLGKPFSRFARNGMSKIGHIAPQEKIKQLRDLGARLYLCGPSMDHFGVQKEDLLFDDVTIAEYLTFMEIMGRADIHIYS